MTEQTLDQRRAQDAWEQSRECSPEYQNLAKGLPALIMNSGLLQTFAFLNEKGQEKSEIAEHLRAWLGTQFGLPTPFNEFMDQLVKEPPSRYQEITTEAHAWLRWMRQMAAARCTKGE